ncbi:TetR/AcrR family transcriptional regulator [Bifidobacterium eulemuris]|uniref:TetR family transcriptional regulator n=1 Tax=Bifidobacterium eulemuris TaxID=1765219 RepID=A0A261G7I6_9BIFI|nr:TetR/AcrR family transcriptional regulator [Bifidobacterium eulemuris]OZG67389.1 TetR family transcriptional regulator [Bifidobacterium eulemuris]QOL32959.1 TetR/AcrR family transcriptional regulator [Bifidobacterium eulemuris]
MHHVSNDKRARQSAELICDGLERCLREKEYRKIHVRDICERSYVSRATFYRLFDAIDDVLSYRCDRIFQELADELSQRRFATNRDLLLVFIERWLGHGTLVSTLVENNLTGIIYDTHMRNGELMKRIFADASTMTDAESDYLVSILTNILPAVMNTWHLHGQTESPEEIYAHAGASIAVIADALNR